MSTKYKFRNQEIPHFVSFAVVDWIDVFVRNTVPQPNKSPNPATLEYSQINT